MNRNNEEKAPNKFFEIIKTIVVKYNVGLIILSIITALAFAISSV